MQMGDHIRVQRVSNAAAAGITAVNSDLVDMQGAESVEFEVHFGAITAGAVTSVKAQGGAAANASDAADLAGTGVAVADTADNKVVRLEVVRPEQRYVRCVVSRATQNAVIDSIVARVYYGRKVPVTQHATVAGAKAVLSPDLGAP
jgi:hypothetical protein